jgi:U3 small nucleolar RNA-associated protein 13
MAYKASVRTTFEPSRVIQPIYTGGSVSLSEDGAVLATVLGEEALLTDLNNGRHLARVEGVGYHVHEILSLD